MTEPSPVARRGQLLATLRVQYPDLLAERGFRPLHPVSGEPYGDQRRHLVATCRSIANFAVGAVVDGPDWCTDAAEHGLEFLREAHRIDDEDGYHLVVDPDGNPLDRTRSAYGHAFVLLAFARAAEAGIDGAETDLTATHELVENRLRDDAGMVRSDCAPDWTEQEAYRGQNANMHACEAYLAAYEATERTEYLDRARHIARTVTVDLAAETNGLLWEHYTDDWEHDFGYNEDEPRHQFRPPGYQPGHHIEWAKLLALLDRYHDVTTADATSKDEYAPKDGWYARALSLFETAIDNGWREDGFIYTHNGDGAPIVADQYGWALAEAIGASAALIERATANNDADAADRLWNLNRRFLAYIDHYRGPAGLWYERRLAANDGGDPVSAEPPGVEPDYHPVSAFYECWRSAQDAQTDNRPFRITKTDD